MRALLVRAKGIQMRYERIATLLLLLLVAVAPAGCTGNLPKDPAEPVFSVQRFAANSALIDNPYHPLVPGTVRIYQVEGADGIETIVVEVLDETRLIWPVSAGIIRGTVRRSVDRPGPTRKARHSFLWRRRD